MGRRCIIVGLGGIGSWLAEGLVRMLEYKEEGSILLLVDGDTFEPKNTERQNFAEMGNKAKVVADKLIASFPKTFVVGIDKWVVPSIVQADGDSEEETERQITAQSLIRDGDIVYGVVDNFACRKLLVEAASELDSCDVFLGGNEETLFGSVYHYQRRNGQDITQNPIERSPQLSDPPDRNPGQMSCQERAELEGGTQLIASNFGVAAWLLGRTQHCIIEGNDPTESEIFFDMAQGLAKPYDRLVESSEEVNIHG